MRAPLWLAVVLSSLATSALCDWTFAPTWTEPIQGFETRAAITVNPDGFALHLYRNPVGRVYALISLPQGTPDLQRDGVVAILTPQGFAPKNIEAQDERGRVVEYATSTGRMLRDRLWHGEGQSPTFGTFHDILEAPSLNATLMLTDGTQVDTTWSMDSAGTVIAQALGISIDGIPAGAEWEDAASQSLLAAMTACQFPKLDVLCVQKVTNCSAQISEERDIDGFEACVAEGG